MSWKIAKAEGAEIVGKLLFRHGFGMTKIILRAADREFIRQSKIAEKHGEKGAQPSPQGAQERGKP